MHSLVEVEGPAEGLEGRFLQVGFCGTVSADEVEAKAFCLQETLGHDAGFDPSGRKGLSGPITARPFVGPMCLHFIKISYICGKFLKIPTICKKKTENTSSEW